MHHQNSSRTLAVVVLILTLIGFSGCSIHPSLVTPDPDSAETGNTPGFRYYLPLDHIRLEASERTTKTLSPERGPEEA